MPRILPTLCAGLLGLVALPAMSQQVPAARTPVVVPPPIGSQDDRSRQTVPDSPMQRPRSSSPIPSEGPAKLLAPPPPTLQQPRAETDTVPMPTRVFDASGRPLSGMLRVAPNRAFDPATGRYYRTTSAGKLLEPPPAGR